MCSFIVFMPLLTDWHLYPGMKMLILYGIYPDMWWVTPTLHPTSLSGELFLLTFLCKQPKTSILPMASICLHAVIQAQYWRIYWRIKVIQCTMHSLHWTILKCSVWDIKSFHILSTYSGDDSSSKKEGTTQIPVAWVVGGITNRIHSSIHSLHRVLRR